MIVNEITVNEAIFISIFSMVIVFLVLVSISYLIDIISFFVNRKGGRHE